MGSKIINLLKGTDKKVVSEIKQIHTLKKFSEELQIHWKILRNIENLLNQIDSENIDKIEELFSKIKKEVEIIIKELRKIEYFDLKIKEKSKQIISKHEKPPFENEQKQFTVVNIENKKIDLNEKKILNLISSNKERIMKSISYLKEITALRGISLSQRKVLRLRINRMQIELEKLFLQTQAIIALEAELAREEKKSERIIKQLKKTA